VGKEIESLRKNTERVARKLFPYLLAMTKTRLRLGDFWSFKCPGRLEV